MFRRFLHKATHCLCYGVHAKPITTVYEGGTADGLLDEVLEEMGFGVVELFDASF